MDKRYMWYWLQTNYNMVNASWKEPPQLLGGKGIRAAEQDEFQTLGQALATRLEQVVLRDRPERFKRFEFVIAKSGPDERGAWAFWPSECYGILVQQGLIENMQAVCGQIGALMTQAHALPPDEANFLQNLWKGIPVCSDRYFSYGEVLAQIAFDFIVHHELAHAGLGHEWIIQCASASEFELGQPDKEGVCVLEELSGSAAASGRAGGESWRQPLEADADLNGLRYTIQYVEFQADRFDALTVSAGDGRGLVWKHFLTNDSLRWFTIMAGVSIGLCCLLSQQTSGLGNLADKSHPPVPARVLVMLHAARQLHPSANQVEMAEVLLFVTALFAMLRTAQGSQTETVESILAWFSIDEAMNRFGDIASHFESLAVDMRKLSGMRDHLRRFPDFLRWEWYAEGAKEGLQSPGPNRAA